MKRKPRVLPATIFCCRRMGNQPNAHIIVRAPGFMDIQWTGITEQVQDRDGGGVRMSRGLARLLMRRIAQVLRETR